ncbi:hypothetical protein DXU06_28090 [Bradyrhizobium elkanii]|nr:hypothetical protein [Bradyrhizobium elkanii]QOZ20549.1 hypothetical protein XI02_40480 [Bradyrhizobium sp. CCBAU 21365]
MGERFGACASKEEAHAGSRTRTSIHGSEENARRRFQAYADRIVVRQHGRIVAEHPGSFGRRETTYDDRSCSWRKITSCSGPLSARQASMRRRSSARRMLGLRSVCRRRSSSSSHPAASTQPSSPETPAVQSRPPWRAGFRLHSAKFLSVDHQPPTADRGSGCL